MSMNVFAVDSAGKTASVAILQDGVLLYESYLANGLTHSETLMPLVENAFAVTGLCAADIGLFCVNGGPGSFTGLRIGMALVKGIALPNKTPCAGVSTLESLAYTFAGEGIVIAALNARRGEVYSAAFRAENGNVTRLTEDTAAHASELLAFASAQNEKIYLMGDGADIVQNAFACEISSQIYPAPYVNGRAHAVALCGLKMYENGQAITAAQLSAEYCRLSQAERIREEKAKIEI